MNTRSLIALAALAALALAGCADDDATPDAAPDAYVPEWSCRMFADCAGQVQISESTVSAGTESDAEIQLVDRCEMETCSGALACHAICQPLQP